MVLVDVDLNTLLDNPVQNLIAVSQLATLLHMSVPYTTIVHAHLARLLNRHVLVPLHVVPTEPLRSLRSEVKDKFV